MGAAEAAVLDRRPPRRLSLCQQDQAAARPDNPLRSARRQNISDEKEFEKAWMESRAKKLEAAGFEAVYK